MIVANYYQVMEKQPMIYTHDSGHRGVKCYVNKEWINNQGDSHCVSTGGF